MEAISRYNLEHLNQLNEKNKYCFKDIRDSLVKKFLYENDVECLSILLNIYNLEDSMESISPSYITVKNLKKDIIHFLKNKEGKELIASNLSGRIHDDVNRLELFMYLEGYKMGFNATTSANKLECLTFKYMDLEELYQRRKLFNYEVNNEEIVNLKDDYIKNLRADKQVEKHVKSIVNKFETNILKDKIMEINKYIDKQLVFDFESGGYVFKETNSHLTKKELHGLNRKIVRFLYIDGFRVLENAYWDGINDRVMKRYK